MFDQQVTFIYASDLETSTQFYNSVLRLEQVLDQGACRIFRVSQDGFVGICQCREGTSPVTDGVIVTFVHEDVDGWYETLVSSGQTIEKPPALNPDFNIYHFFLRDPDGYLLEIQRFCDPAWPKSQKITSSGQV